jgi:hypothetical protein
MTAQELLHQQRELAPKQDLTEFAGEWIVLRYGMVVDHARGMDELISRGLADQDSVLRISRIAGTFAF